MILLFNQFSKTEQFSRLIRGDGEILEEIVTRDRHKLINQEATRGDGHTFQMNTVGTSASKY